MSLHRRSALRTSTTLGAFLNEPDTTAPTMESSATSCISNFRRNFKSLLLIGLGYVLGQNFVAKYSEVKPKIVHLDSDSEPELSTDEIVPPPPPKHIPFPDVPQSSEMLNELLMFGYTSLATSLQFLHLYRTVWWLPESHTKYAMVSKYSY